MRQWNERQPGGQGLAADFENYFKSLSSADKEVRLSDLDILSPSPVSS